MSIIRELLAMGPKQQEYLQLWLGISDTASMMAMADWCEEGGYLELAKNWCDNVKANRMKNENHRNCG